MKKLFPTFPFQDYSSKLKPRSSLTPDDVDCQSSADAIATNSKATTATRLPNRIHSTSFVNYLPFVNRDAQCAHLIQRLQDQYLCCRGARPMDFEHVKRAFNVIYSAGAPGIGKFKCHCASAGSPLQLCTYAYISVHRLITMIWTQVD